MQYRFSLATLAWIGVVAVMAPWAFAVADEEKSSNQPYIDQIRKNLPAEDKSGSFIESIRKDLPPKSSSEGYTEKLKKELSRPSETSPEGKTFLEQQKTLLPEKETGGAIAAYNEGRSQLKPKYAGDIHQALGLRYGVSMSRDVTGASDVVLRPFNNVFGENYVPDLGFFYEYQLVHDEHFGSLGIVGNASISYYYGKGKYQFDLKKPWNTSQSFGFDAPTQFQFYSIPLSVGFNYRFNLLHFLRPFVMAAPGGVLYFESRNDNQDGHRGISKSIYLVGGVSILMDWISRTESWDAYQSFGVRHSYLTVQYESLSTFASDVNFSFSGITAGVTFEY